MISYNFRNGYALLSYLEYPIILIQEFILIFLVLKYKDLLNIYTLAASVIYFSIAASFLIGVVPLGLLSFLVVCVMLKFSDLIFKKYYFSLCVHQLGLVQK